MSTSQPESLRDIAQVAADRHGVKGRGMERLAEKAGREISRSTFDKILAGTYHSRATQGTLEALAYLAGISERRVFEAAGRKYKASPFAEQLPPDIDMLSDDQRNAVITVARAFLNANREIEGLQNELQRISTPKPSNRHLFPVEDVDSEDAGEEQKIERAAHTNLDPEIGPEDTPHET